MTSITIKEYFAVPGSPYSNKDARKIGPILQELSEQGGLTTRDVVDAARSPQSPLHEYFEWDDKVAADKWRLDRARNMLSSIKVRVIENDEVREARAFHVERVRAYESEPRKYRTFEVLHGDSAFAAQMMDSAIDDLRTWRRKYEPYAGMWKNFGDAFQQVVNQISEWSDECAIDQAASDTDEVLLRLLAWREESTAVLQTWIAAREHVEYIMQAIGNAEATFAKVAEHKHRDCLKCGKSFVSVSVGNRICKSCLNSKTINEKNINVIDATMAGS